MGAPSSGCTTGKDGVEVVLVEARAQVVVADVLVVNVEALVNEGIVVGLAVVVGDVRAPSPLIKGLTTIILIWAAKPKDYMEDWHSFMYLFPFWEFGSAVLTLKKRNAMLRAGAHDGAKAFSGAPFWAKKLVPLFLVRMVLVFGLR